MNRIATVSALAFGLCLFACAAPSEGDEDAESGGQAQTGTKAAAAGGDTVVVDFTKKEAQGRVPPGGSTTFVLKLEPDSAARIFVNGLGEASWAHDGKRGDERLIWLVNESSSSRKYEVTWRSSNDKSLQVDAQRFSNPQVASTQGKKPGDFYCSSSVACPAPWVCPKHSEPAVGELAGEKIGICGTRMPDGF